MNVRHQYTRGQHSSNKYLAVTMESKKSEQSGVIECHDIVTGR